PMWAGGRAGGGPADDPGGLELRRVDPWQAAAVGTRSHLARALVFRGDVAGTGRRAVLRCIPVDRFGLVGVPCDQAGDLRPAAAGVPDRCPPHVPVLRRQYRAGLPAMAADVAAGRDLGAGDAAPAARAAARLRLAVAGGPADAAAVGVRAVALVAARRGARAAARAVRRPAVVAGHVRAVLAAE